MPAEVAPLRADGDRVWVRTVHQGDLPAYRLAVEQSRSRLAAWNPVNPNDLVAHLAAQSQTHRTFLVHALAPEGPHDIVGKVNITNVVRGRLNSAAIGYDAYDPYAGRGLFAEGMRLVLDLAFAPEPAGMGLHRVEASVQPANSASAGLLRSLGFRREGWSPRMMWLADAHGTERWRDHDRYAITGEEWPAVPYADQAEPRIGCLVNGVPGAGTTTLAHRLAVELGTPLFARDRLQDTTDPDRLVWVLLADSSAGGIVEGWFRAGDAGQVTVGLEGAGLDPARVPEVCCDLPGGQAGRPLGLGPTLRVDASGQLAAAAVTRLALEIRRLNGR